MPVNFGPGNNSGRDDDANDLFSQYLARMGGGVARVDLGRIAEPDTRQLIGLALRDAHNGGAHNGGAHSGGARPVDALHLLRALTVNPSAAALLERAGISPPELAERAQKALPDAGGADLVGLGGAAATFGPSASAPMKVSEMSAIAESSPPCAKPWCWRRSSRSGTCKVAPPGVMSVNCAPMRVEKDCAAITRLAKASSSAGD